MHDDESHETVETTVLPREFFIDNDEEEPEEAPPTQGLVSPSPDSLTVQVSSSDILHISAWPDLAENSTANERLYNVLR
jgi:hypothetical protein